jgi:hypothetical protein
LRLDFVLVLFVLVLVSELRFLSRACHDYNSFCLLSAPLSIVITSNKTRTRESPILHGMPAGMNSIVTTIQNISIPHFSVRTCVAFDKTRTNNQQSASKRARTKNQQQHVTEQKQRRSWEQKRLNRAEKKNEKASYKQALHKYSLPVVAPPRGTSGGLDPWWPGSTGAWAYGGQGPSPPAGSRAHPLSDPGSSRCPSGRRAGPRRSQHAGQVSALHHRQLAEHISEVGGALVPGFGHGGVGGFAVKLHGWN